LSHHWGYVSAVVSAILFGVNSTLNKIALENVNPTIVAGMIYFVAGVFLSIIHLSPLCKKILTALDTPETEAKITKRDYRVLAFVIFSGSIVAPLLLLNGLNQTTAINSSLLLNAESLFTVAIAFIFLNERCGKGEYLGILILLFGVIFVTTNGAFQNLSLTEHLIGNLLIIGACFFWGIDNNISKFLSIAFSILFFLFALRKIGSMRTGVIFSLSSLFGAVTAFVVLRESFTIIQLVAGSVMILGIYVLYRCGARRPADSLIGNS
jgi:drug/metabolite transporter (DMT)-like permease